MARSFDNTTEHSSFDRSSPSTYTLTDHSLSTKGNRHSSPQPGVSPPGYMLVRKTPRPFSSIEQFDFKSIPIPPLPPLPPSPPSPPAAAAATCSSGLTDLSSINTSDMSTAILVKQSRRHNENTPHELDTLGPTTDATNRPPEENAGMTPDHHQRQRNYHSFPGNHIFFCGGRLMTSRAYWAFLIAWTLLVVPSVLFGIFTCPFIWSNIHPVIPLLFAYMFLLAVASMLKTSWTDPGVLPRGLEPSFDHQSSISTSQPLPMDRCVKIKDNMWYIKYCSTCHIYRPPRASHCRQCDNCVENEDHHCIWLNNCIGKRNYRPFFTFITTCTVMAIYVIVFTVVHLLMAARRIQPNIDFHLIFQTTPVSFILAIVGFFLLWMVGGLTLYHCHLIWKGLTTHEKLRSTLWEDVSQPNPYAMTSPMLNIVHILCRPQPKSHLRRRKYPDTP